MKLTCIIIISIACVPLRGQTPPADSLREALKGAKHDSARAQILLSLGEEIYLQQPDSALEIWKKAKALAEQKKDGYIHGSRERNSLEQALGAAYNNLGYLYQQKGNYPLARDYYEKSLVLSAKTGNKQCESDALTNLGLLFDVQSDFKTALQYYEKSLKIKESIGNKKGIAYCLNNIGNIYENLGQTDKAIMHYEKSLKISEEVADKHGTANTLNNLGYIYDSQGNLLKALEYYSRSIKILETLGDKNGTATLLNNIGIIYRGQGDLAKAMECYQKGLAISEEIGNKRGAALCTNNMAFVYQLQRNNVKALAFFSRSIENYKLVDDRRGIAITMNNIGGVYNAMGDPTVTSSKENSLRAGLSKALPYFQDALKIQEEIGDRGAAAASLNNIGSIYFKQKDFETALEYSSRAMVLSRELGYPSAIKNAAERLYQVYKATNKHRLALEHYELFIKMRDSISNESTRKASIRQQLKYEYEKQAAADSVAHAKESEIKSAELNRQSAELRAKKNQQYALFGGLGLVMVFAGFMYNRFKITQRQKLVIELQKVEVEEQKKLVEAKQKEILDSIHYARKIQMAQIPSEKQVSGILTKLKA